MDVPVLETDDVSVRRGDQPILEELSLSIPAGSRTLVQGPSGAGKSTLFSVLGLLESPDSGRVLVDGTDTSKLSERQRARLRRDTIGVVFQDYQLVSDLTVRENALLPQHHGGNRDEAWVDELLEALAVADGVDRYPATLSNGEKQRVAIARALANRPDVILADEPTGQLDPETTDRLTNVLFDVQHRTESALVIISHDQSLEGPFDRTLTLRAGDTVAPR
ncbi:ABC transporter ATP-binding protein [Natronococcus amylolyticus DSM 10524]|uniref:ABC transporter ATP-binding protein n=1 Tax=Natronococcus amylolyticus DSM 10524 TaxID=1227497 RepID=L9WZN3_9EURY|nr:ABC transporter ATP-binding protein [Natronococcus amylolyticus]ELY54949.1 ABC transporter ATP-binding protein [Natronococcus amylolyticus DSM 10524]